MQTRTSIQRHLGSDEAGYGPTIGPLCVATVAVDTADRDELDQGLRALGVGDSKQVYRGKNLRRLESIALAALEWLTGWQPSSANELQQLAGAPPPDLTSDPWLGHALALPLSGPAATWTELPPGQVRLSIVHAHELNAQRQAGRNRHHSEWQALAQQWQDLIQTPLPVNAVCDRLGGRRHYADLLQAAFPAAQVAPAEVLPDGCSHQLTLAERPLSCAFLSKADHSDALCGLASCLAKYAREVCMQQFNAYWTGRLRSLAATAGYPADSKRFRFQMGSGLFSAYGDRFWRWSADELATNETFESISD